MRLPDGPSTPKLWQEIQLVADPVGYLEAAAQNFGDIFSTSIHGKPEVFVSNPQALQQIFSHDTQQFAAPGDRNRFMQPFVGDHSLFLLSGNSHQRHRQLLMGTLHGELRAYGKLICEIASQAIDKLRVGEPFIARSMMEDISLQIMLQVLFGLSEEKGYQLLKENLSSMMDLFNSPLGASFLYLRWLQRDFGPWSPWGKFSRQKQVVDEIIYAEIFSRRQQLDPNRTDILSLLMSARDVAGEPMNDVELHDELLTLLLAGHETTATAMAWALYWVHYLPEVGKKLLAELDTLDRDRDPTSISPLSYLTAVCNETLRIYPVLLINFPRVVQEPVELLDYKLPPGTVVNGCIYLLHQRPDLYPQPQQFNPDRFLLRQYSPYEFMPFGAGVRRCIGSALAMYEMKLVLTTILLNYQLELVERRPVKPQRRGVTLAPAGGVKMVLKGRRDRLPGN